MENTEENIKTEDEIRKELIEKFYQIANDFDEKDFVEFGTGEKGKEFLQKENSPIKAAKFLLNKKTGMVRNAFKNTPYGNVGLAYGDDDSGMYHMVGKHILEFDDFDSVTETINTIDDVLRTGTQVVNKNKKDLNKINIKKGNFLVVIGTNPNGNLIVTSYDYVRRPRVKQRKSSDITLIDRNAFMKDGTLVPSEDWLNYNIKNSDLSNLQIQFLVSENDISNKKGEQSMESTNENQKKTLNATDYLIQKINNSGIEVHLSKEEMKAILDAGKDVQKMAVKFGTNKEIGDNSFNGYGTYVVSLNEENARQFGIKIAARKYGGTFYINNQPLSDFLQDKNFSPFWSKRLEEVKSHSVDELTDEVLRADVKGNPQLEREQQAMSTLLGLDLIEYKREQTYLYSVDIPDNDNTNYLMYNNPIGIDAANKINEQLEKMSVDWRVSRNDSGKSVYFDVLSKNIFGNNQKPASEFLNSIGFVGMQMDSSNYIIFNDRNMSITDRVQYMKDREGEVYGFAFEGDIYVDEDLVNSNVLAHEYTHIWDKYVQNENPELWQQGKDILKGTSIWQEIVEDKNYETLKTDDEILSEVHARITGQFAQQVLERIEKQDGQLTKDRAIDWDKEVNEFVTEELLIKPELGSENYISDTVKAEYLKKFLSMPMKDLMNEVQIGRNLDIKKVLKPGQNIEPLYFGDIEDGAVNVYTKEQYIEKFGEEPSENSRLDDDQVKDWQKTESMQTTKSIIKASDFIKEVAGDVGNSKEIYEGLINYLYHRSAIQEVGKESVDNFQTLFKSFVANNVTSEIARNGLIEKIKKYDDKTIIFNPGEIDVGVVGLTDREGEAALKDQLKKLKESYSTLVNNLHNQNFDELEENHKRLVRAAETDSTDPIEVLEEFYNTPLNPPTEEDIENEKSLYDKYIQNELDKTVEDLQVKKGGLTEVDIEADRENEKQLKDSWGKEFPAPNYWNADDISKWNEMTGSGVKDLEIISTLDFVTEAAKVINGQEPLEYINNLDYMILPKKIESIDVLVNEEKKHRNSAYELFQREYKTQQSPQETVITYEDSSERNQRIDQIETVDNGIEKVQSNGGMSEAAMEADIAVQKDVVDEPEYQEEPVIMFYDSNKNPHYPQTVLSVLENFSAIDSSKWNLLPEDKTAVFHLLDVSELKKNDYENSVIKLREYLQSEEFGREEENYARIFTPILMTNQGQDFDPVTHTFSSETFSFPFSTDDLKSSIPVVKGEIESIAGNPFTGNNERLVQGFQNELISRGIVKPEEKLILLTEVEANARGSKIKENQPFVLLNIPVQNGEKTEFVSTKYYHISSLENQQQIETEKKAGKGIEFGKTKVPEVSLITQNGLQLFKDMIVDSYDQNSKMYHLKLQDGEKSLNITENTLKVLMTDDYRKQAKSYTEDTKVKEKMIMAQYKDFFEARSNCANNFRHNLSVFCRKEANSPLDALQIAGSIIKQMPKEEQHKTKELLNLLKKDGQTINEVLIETYHDAVKDSPLNEEYLKRGRYENIIARPMYDTKSREGERIDKDFNLKIGDTVDVQFKVSKSVMGKMTGKEKLTFANCKIISASKENNMVTLMDGNKSFYDVPRDTFLKEYARTEKLEHRQEKSNSHKHSMKIEITR